MPEPVVQAKPVAQKQAVPTKPTLAATGSPAPAQTDSSTKVSSSPAKQQPIGSVAAEARTDSDKPDQPSGDTAGIASEAFSIETGRVRLSLTTSVAALVAAGLVVGLVMLWVLAYSMGQSAADARLASSLTDDAGRAVEATGAAAGDDPVDLIREPRDTVRTPSQPVREAQQQPTVVAITPDPVVTDPVPTTPPETSPAAEPEADRYADTRQAGLNYLALGQISDREEALRTVDYLIHNGVPALAVEGRDRAGNTQFRLFTLFGVPGEGFRSNPERIEHQQTVFELGERWISEFRGRLNFSSAAQVQWTKYNPGG